MKPYITEYRVIYADCDPFDVMYYANYLTLFERGRTEFFRSLGLAYRDISDRGIYTPVSEAHCKYFKSVRYDDLLLIETTIGLLKKASIRVDHDIYKKEPRMLLARGYTVLAFVNRDVKIQPVPPDVVEKIRHLLGEDAAQCQ
jgi:acyl-CoA thioester hydrolase